MTRWLTMLFLLLTVPAALDALPAQGAGAEPPLVPAPPAAVTSGPLELFDYTMTVVEANFHDRTMGGLKWSEMVAGTRRQLGPKADEVQVREAIGSLLAQLGTSEARFLTDDEQDYWMLLSAFGGRLDDGRVRQIGAWFERRGRRWFVRNVAPGSPAERAGLVRGDEVVSVEGAGLAPVASFRQLRPSAKAAVTFRRMAWAQPQAVAVETTVESFQESLLRGMRQGRRTLEVQGKRIAYVALPASTHDLFREALAQAARDAEASADALVLDLRDGYGGADLAYLEPFFPMPAAAGNTKPTPALYTKPLVTLVNGGTRGGKEWLAWFIQHHKRGTLIGEHTAGAFLAARLFELVPRRYALYLGVSDPRGVAAQLEGRGVMPDQVVEAPLVYAAGDDPQLRQGLATAADLAKK